MRGQAKILLAVLALAVGGCATELLPAPDLDEVCLVENPEACLDWTYAGSRAEVQLLGDHFHPVFEVDIGSDDPPVAQSTFEARIGDVELEGLELGTEPVRGHDTLRGTLSGRLPLGWHHAQLQAPSGLTASLSNAFRIVNPLDLEAFRDEPQIPQGSQVTVQVHLENTGLVLLNDVALTLSQAGAGRMQLPDPPSPFVLEAGERLELPLALEAIEQGDVTVGIEADALANGAVAVGPESPATVQFLVREPADLTASARLSASSLPAGESFDLLVEVHNPGGMPALDVRPQSVLVDGSGDVQMEPEPQPPVVGLLEEGRTRIFRWSGITTQEGTVTLRALVVGQEAISQRLLGPVETEPATLEVTH